MWSWLRYWFLDTENHVTFMLLDKGYYDYDYEAPKGKPKRLTAEQRRMWSDAELRVILGRAIDPTTGKSVFGEKKPLTPEELQAEVMREEKKKRQG